MKVKEIQLNKSADFYSESVDLELHSKLSVQITTSNGSSFAATVTLQVSNDKSLWLDVAGSSASLSGASDSQIYDLPDTSVSFARVSVDITSGSADFAINWDIK